jgi:hypothetical protein
MGLCVSNPSKAEITDDDKAKHREAEKLLKEVCRNGYRAYTSLIADIHTI